MSAEDSGNPTNSIGSGLGGTNNVCSLFPDAPSAAPIPPQASILEELDRVTPDVKSGRIVGLIMIGFDEAGNISESISGKISINDGIAALERTKYSMLNRDLIRRLGLK